MSGLSVAKSLGHHGHWGFSAGFDILEGLTGLNSSSDDEEGPITVLLVQPGDIRHILYTIARQRRYRKNKLKPLRPIHFYIFESTIEVLARNLLLFEVINDYEVPIRQRANTFLEIYGNNKVQRRTSAYIEQLGCQLRLLLTKNIGQFNNVIDFSMLRYREKDELEVAFKGYAKNSVFDMNTLYDHRQRGLYEDRFDSRKALFDWDYHTTLKQKASIVHIKQYKEWRGSGIAFEFGDQTYSEPNKTLMSYTEGTMKKGKEQGIKKEIKGFWGDISISPYLSFGIDSETPNKHAEGLFDIYNKNTGTEQHRHHAVEVALYNLFSVLWETETGQAYRMTKSNDIYSGLGAEASILSSKLDSLDSSDATKAEEEASVLAAAAAQEEQSLLPIIEASEEEEKEEESPVAFKNKRDESDADIDLTTDDPETEREREPTGGNNDSMVASSSSSSSSGGASKGTTSVGEASPAHKEEVDPLKAREREVAKAVQRAETISESYASVKIFPMSGTTAGALDKPKFKAFFDCVFVSSRAAQMLSEGYVGSLLKQSGSAYAAVETGKFIVPLSQALKEELLKKEVELAEGLGWKKIPAPVRRRRRDELDKEDDVVFFKR